MSARNPVRYFLDSTRRRSWSNLPSSCNLLVTHSSSQDTHKTPQQGVQAPEQVHPRRVSSVQKIAGATSTMIKHHDESLTLLSARLIEGAAFNRYFGRVLDRVKVYIVSNSLL